MSVIRNSSYNLVGMVIPVAVSLVTIPITISLIGEARYGVLALVWLALSYFGQFDLGLSNAATNALSRDRAEGGAQSGAILRSAVLVNLVLGCTVGTIIYFLASYGVSYLKTDSGLQRELTTALPWVAACIPIISVGASLIGGLISLERFALTTSIGVLGNVLFQVAPMFTAWLVSPSLIWIIPVAVVARSIPTIVSAIAVSTYIKWISASFDSKQMSALLSYGGWIMVSNIVGPLLVSIDQFAIGAFVGVIAVTYYNVSYSLASKLLMVPNAVATTLFPRLSYLDGATAFQMGQKANEISILVLAAATIPAVLLTKPFLSLWLNPSFADAAADTAVILFLAAAVNGAAYLPVTYLRSRQKPHVTAIIHVSEIIPFLGVLWLGLRYYGVEGAAGAWLFRALLDLLLFNWFSGFRSIRPLMPLVLAALVTLLNFVSPLFAWLIGVPFSLYLSYLSFIQLRPYLPMLVRKS